MPRGILNKISLDVRSAYLKACEALALGNLVVRDCQIALGKAQESQRKLMEASVLAARAMDEAQL